jgi:hypothetical protein
MCEKCVEAGKMTEEERKSAEVYGTTFSKAVMEAIYSHPQPTSRAEVGMILSLMMKLAVHTYQVLNGDEEDPAKFIEFAVQVYGKEAMNMDIEVVNMGEMTPQCSKEKAN